MKIRNRELKNWIFRKFQVAITSHSSSHDLKLTNIGLSSFYEENNFQSFLKMPLWASVWIGSNVKNTLFIKTSLKSIQIELKNFPSVSSFQMLICN